ncbi:MAG TPA: hypothetical protein VGN04_05245 [Herbaspirillum sp.]|jgi:hypothetical protein
MNIKLLPPLLVAALAGCAAPPPQPVKPAEQPMLAASRSLSDTLLAYHRSLDNASQADLNKELGILMHAPPGAETEVRKAIVLGAMRDSGRLARARSILAGVLLMDDPDALALRPLVEWMINNNSELRSLTLQGERQTHQLKDLQRRLDQSNEKLEAMKRIESSQPASPIEIAPAN